MRTSHMQNNHYQRFAISIPEGMAVQIKAVCQSEGRNRSEFFREAVRHYIGTYDSSRASSRMMPKSLRTDERFMPVADVQGRGYSAYESLSDKASKDHELEMWAKMVETDPAFADVRAVSDDVNAIAGEAEMA
jgi:Arc/MetJ-type ribon-helix-helix transcriptional regulator